MVQSVNPYDVAINTDAQQQKKSQSTGGRFNHVCCLANEVLEVAYFLKHKFINPHMRLMYCEVKWN